ncbi:MAG: radical SAM protein [Deltaproteobacteria bacterium]|uniref:Radical SAM protein n=1 Tax=Candidatus Zymogenus saltonus TaxID=2844893 RepID=A0A9D8KB14_9DELT|nr:radical SAM protein [Candidatus Zymogenus saltonus]
MGGRAGKSAESPDRRERVVLVNPPAGVVNKETRYRLPILNSLPQLGILYIAGVLLKEGIDVRVLDAQALGLDAAETVDRVRRWSPKVLGLTGYTSTVGLAHEVAKGLKKTFPDLVTVLGGPHVTAVPEKTLTRFPAFDCALMGEGEDSIASLFKSLVNGGLNAEAKKIAGVIYRDGKDIRINERPPLIKDLDTIPPPPFELLPGFPRLYSPPIFHSPRRLAATLVTSRGCPFSCTFCDRAVFGNRYRHHSVEYIIDMIRRLKVDHGIDHIIFYDDNFTVDRDHLTGLLEEILRLPFPITWNSDARTDLVTPELLRLMKRAGAFMINYGIETADPTLLESMEKTLSPETAARAVSMTTEAGIYVKGLFIVGAPGETRESIERTKDFISDLPFALINASKYTPYPGCEAYEDIEKYGAFDEDWEKMNAMNFVFWPDTIDRESLVKGYNDLLKSFYKNPKQWKTFKVMLKENRFDRLRLLKATLGHIRYVAKKALLRKKGLDKFDL